MKNLKIFIIIFSVSICTNIFPDGYIQIHNKTKYQAMITYNFGTRDKSININKYENSQILSTYRGLFRSQSGNINKLKTKLSYKNKKVDFILMDNLDIEVNQNKITHIYIIYVNESIKNPKLRIACIKEGKIIKKPYLKKDTPSIKAYCDNSLKILMKPRISFIPKNLANDRAIFLIQNKSGLPIKIKMPSLSLHKDYASIKKIYLHPGDYYYQTLDEVFEVKNSIIQEIDGKRKKTINKIKIPTGMVTTVNINKYGDNALRTDIKRIQKISNVS